MIVRAREAISQMELGDYQSPKCIWEVFGNLPNVFGRFSSRLGRLALSPVISVAHIVVKKHIETIYIETILSWGQKFLNLMNPGCY